MSKWMTLSTYVRNYGDVFHQAGGMRGPDLSQAEERTGLGKAEASATTEAEPIIEGLNAARRHKRKTERRELWPKDLPVVVANPRAGGSQVRSAEQVRAAISQVRHREF